MCSLSVEFRTYDKLKEKNENNNMQDAVHVSLFVEVFTQRTENEH